MNKNDLLEEIEELLNQITDDEFTVLWNKLFREEIIDSVEDNRYDLQSLLLEEIEVFDKSKILKIHKYLSSRV